MAPVLCLPFHQDEPLGVDALALPENVAQSVVEPVLQGSGRWPRLTALYEALAAGVATQVGSSRRTTVVTGDCLALLGTLAGAQRSGLDPSLVWFDAHGDLHTMSSSTSGYLGGMALRMAMGGDSDKLARPLGLRPVPEDRVTLVGARDLDPAEDDYLATSAINRTSVSELRPGDLPDGPLLLHIDLDVIDASEIPGLRFPAQAGPSSAEVLASAGQLVDDRGVAVVSVACSWYPAANREEQRTREELLTTLLERLGA